MSQYALVGQVSRELLSYEGQVMVHPDRGELEWLFPGLQTAPVDPETLGRPVMRLQDHPDMAAVTWPLDRRDFR